MATQNREVWSQQSDRKIVMTSDGAWYLQKENLVPINPAKALEKAVKNIGWLTPMLGPGSYVYFKQGVTVVMQRISKIPFAIEMLATAGNEGDKKKTVYVPAFNSAGIETDPPFIYRPPKHLWLMLCIQVEEPHYPFLVMVDPADGKKYHPIVPNVYDNGKLCVGEGFKFPEYWGEGLEKYLQEYLNSWSQTKWNRDLAGANNSRPLEWLRFDEKTKTNILPEGKDEWKNYCGAPIVPSASVDEALHALYDNVISGGK